MMDLLGIWTVFSMFSVVLLALTSDADSLDADALENKPTTWLLLVWFMPGIVVLVCVGLCFWVLCSPFKLMDYAWGEYQKAQRERQDRIEEYDRIDRDW